MQGEIFLLQSDEELVEMKEKAYDSEDLLQKLLADYPKLLAGNQIDPVNPRRWLLIDRELGIPDQENGSDRWSLDHLFIDHEAVPTLVEVKRSTDTRARREVVAQMLDYAANSVQYWDINQIATIYEKGCHARAVDPEKVLAEFLNDEFEPGEFWEAVATNLRQGKIRMIFVADAISPELLRIVEFLNEQMSPAEVLAIDVKLYEGQNLKTLVSRVLGNTMRAVDKKTGKRLTKKWDRESLLNQISNDGDEGEEDVAVKILDWMDSQRYRIEYGTGAVTGSGRLGFMANGQLCKPFILYGNGSMAVQFDNLKYKFPPFEEEEWRRKLLSMLNAIPDINLPEDKIDTYPSFDLFALADPKYLAQFFAVFQWIETTIKEQTRE